MASTAVQAGIDRCPKCGAPTVPPSATCVRCETHPTAAAPRVVLDGKWELLEKLADGGMGVVHLARDVELDRRVAIKMLTGPLANTAELRARFEREGRLMARVDHRGVVPVYAVGRHEGAPFLVMKYVDGATLSSKLRQAGGKLPLGTVLSVTRQLCSALTAIHACGVVHRDLKPSNVLIDDAEQVTLIDLGVAGVPDSHVTSTGMTVGTPAYMSPEQARGDRNVDGRSDLYSLGALVFHLLAGRPPFLAETDALVLRAHVYETAPRLDSVANVPPAFAAAIARALEKMPARRQPDVAAFLEELELASRGFDPPTPAVLQAVVAAPVATEAPTAADRPSARRLATRTRLALAWLALASALVAGLAWWATGSPPTVTFVPTALPYAAPPPVVVVEPPAPPIPAAVEPLPAVAARPSRQAMATPPASAKPPPARPAEPGELRVTSMLDGERSWATVFVDGERRGNTPLKLTLPAGAHHLRLERPGAQPFEREVSVRASAVEIVQAELTR